MPEHRLQNCKQRMPQKLRVDFKRPVKKLEDEPGNKISGLAGKNQRQGKTKTYLDKPSLWLKRMVLREQENVFLFEFGLIVQAVIKRLF